MRHDTSHEPTRALFDELRAAFEVTEPPAPSPALAMVFATGLTTDNGDLLATAASNANGSASQTAGLPNWTGRRITMIKDLMIHVRTRVAAAVLGATVAMAGMGAAGALNAPIRFVSSFGDDTPACVSAPDESTEDDLAGDALPEDESAACEDQPGDDGVTDDDLDAVDPESASDEPVAGEIPEAPTTVSEAAHIHDFDEACGNHGAYVSHVARFGEEPECATDVRSGVSQDQVDEADANAVEDEAGDDRGKGRPTSRSNHGHGKPKG
ncbi:MAG: hypothetical protein ACT452_06675 [Microthrixaceae bacterium]